VRLHTEREIERITTVLDWLDEKGKELHTGVVIALYIADHAEETRLLAEWNQAERWFKELLARRESLIQCERKLANEQLLKWAAFVRGGGS